MGSLLLLSFFLVVFLFSFLFFLNCFPFKRIFFKKLRSKKKNPFSRNGKKDGAVVFYCGFVRRILGKLFGFIFPRQKRCVNENPNGRHYGASCLFSGTDKSDREIDFFDFNFAVFHQLPEPGCFPYF